MVRGLLVRTLEEAGRARLSVEDERLSVRSAALEATATAVLVESPDAVLVPVDEVGVEAVARIHAAIGPTPIVALTTERDHSLLSDAIAAGAADALPWEWTAGEELADRLVYTLQRRRRQRQSAADVPTEGTPPWTVNQCGVANKTEQWEPGRTEPVDIPQATAADPAAILDSSGTILRAREPFERLVGRSIDTPGTCSLEEFVPEAGREDGDLEAVFALEQRQLDWRQLDVPVLRPDESTCQLTGAVVQAPEASVQSDSAVALFLDSSAIESLDAGDAEMTGGTSGTTGESSKRSTRRSDSAFTQLLETTQTLMTAEAPEVVASSTADATTRLFDCDGAIVRLHEEGQLRATATSGEHFEDGTVPDPVSVGEGTAGRAFEQGEMAHSSTVQQDTDDNEPARLETETDHQPAFAVPVGRYGTLGVVGGSDTDKEAGQLAELLAATAATALDRTDRAHRIKELLAETQVLLDAETPLAVCKRTHEAVRTLLGDEATAVYLTDDTDDALKPVIWSEQTEELVGEPPVIGSGEGKAWDAFESGELRSYDDVASEGNPLNEETSVQSEIHVPLGEHGVVLVGSSEAGVYDEVDEQLMRLLSVNVSRTLDRVHRQQELREYEAAFETVGHLLLICDDSGHITHATEPLAEEIGTERAGILGTSILEHFESDDRSEIQNAFRRAADSGTYDPDTDAISPDDNDIETVETQLRTTDGSSIPVTIEFDPLPGLGRRTVLTITDRSELVEKQSQLARERDRFSYLFDHLPDAVVEVELDDTGPLVTNVNSAFSDIFGYDPELVTGSSLNEIIVPEEERAAAKQLDDRALNGRINTKEVERVTDTGRRQFLFRGIPYELDDQETTYGFGIYTDITEQKERQQHLQVIHRVLRHNLRNDINVVLGGLDVLEPAVEGRKAEFLDDLRKTAEGLVEMSHKAKELAAAIDLDTDDCDPMNVERLVDRVVEIAREKYEEVSFETSTDGNVVQGNPDILSSAVLELIENAVKHGEADRIRIGVTAGSDGVRLRVADDGPGIPEYERDVLTSGTITPLQHGSGLGLWLVRRAAKSCGGTVSFEENGPLSGGTVAIELHRTKPEGDSDHSGERGAQTS